MKQILRKAILISEKLAPMYGKQKVQIFFQLKLQNYWVLIPPITPLQNSHTLSSTQTCTHTHTCNSQFFPPHISEKILSLCLPLRLSCLTHTHTEKTKTQIVANKTLNLNSTINFDAMQTKLIFPNFNLNLASDALKFILIF